MDFFFLLYLDNPLEECVWVTSFSINYQPLSHICSLTLGPMNHISPTNIHITKSLCIYITGGLSCCPTFSWIFSKKVSIYMETFQLLQWMSVTLRDRSLFLLSALTFTKISAVKITPEHDTYCRCRFWLMGLMYKYIWFPGSISQRGSSASAVFSH